MDEHSYELLIGGSVGGREFAPAEMDLQRLVQQEDKGEDENEDEDDVVRVLESGPSSPDDVEQEEDNAPCGGKYLSVCPSVCTQVEWKGVERASYRGESSDDTHRHSRD